MIDAGKSDAEVADECFPAWCRYHNAFTKYRLLQAGCRNWKTKVIILYGDTGVGKSRYCREKFPAAYWKGRDKWFDCYTAQEVVIIDDYYGWLPLDFLLRLCDRYPFDVEVKGSKTAFLAKFIVFTSNVHWTKWYDFDKLGETRKAAFGRRIDVEFYWSETDRNAIETIDNLIGEEE